MPVEAAGCGLAKERPSAAAGLPWSLGHTMLAQFEVTSKLISGPRKVWVQRAVTGAASDCVVFLDGELYLQRVQASKTIDKLQGEGRLPPMDCIYVSSVDATARHTDYICNEMFSEFLAGELRRWIAGAVRRHERYALCGLSLSGLSAGFTALRHPDAFFGAVCQSPSAWWNDEWLATSLAPQAPGHGRFWISVGNQELEEGVSHPPSGLIQTTSQLGSCRRLARQLAGCCAALHYSEFFGGHDPICWATELPEALSWLLQGDAEPPVAHDCSSNTQNRV